MTIGAHVSKNGGYLKAQDRGREIGAECIQIFVQSPRSWQSPVRIESEAIEFRSESTLKSKKILPMYVHASYLINLASPQIELYKRSIAALKDNLNISNIINAAGLILHLGSYKDTTRKDGLKRLIAGLNEVTDSVDTDVPILIENTAGQGNTVGREFDEISGILSELNEADRFGVCIDTQHLFASGYTFESFEAVHHLTSKINSTIGIEKVKCFHFNDSVVESGSLRDRHANLGEGFIGKQSLALIAGTPSFRYLPLILEVPGLNRSGPGKTDVTTGKRLLKKGINLWDLRSL